MCDNPGMRLRPTTSEPQKGSATRLFHTDRIPVKFVILNKKTKDEGSFSYFYYQLENKEGQKLTGSGYSVEEHISPDTGIVTSEGKFQPATNGVSQDLVGYANFSGQNPAPVHLSSDSSGGVMVLQTFTVRYQKRDYNLTTVFVHSTVVIQGLAINEVTDLAP